MTEEEIWAQIQQNAKPPAGSDEDIWAELESKSTANRGALASAGAWLTGSDREETIPSLMDIGVGNLAISDAEKSRIMGLIATSFDDERIKKGFEQAIPDAQYDQDRFGNLVVIAPTKRDDAGKPLAWQRFYPNPKGVDKETAFQAAGVLSAASPISKVIGGTGYTAATVAGGTEAGLYELASSMLANDKYRIGEPVAGAVGGFLTRGLAGLASYLYNRVKGRSGGPSLSANELAQIKEQLKAAGYDADTMQRDLLRQIMRDVQTGADVSESALTRTAENLPVPVPLTRGDVSGNKETQLLEDAIRSGGYGERPRQRIEDIRQEQNAAIAENLPAIQGGLSADRTPIDRGVGGELAQAELVGQKQQAREGYKLLYTSAQTDAPMITPEAGDQVAANVYNRVTKPPEFGGNAFNEVSAPQAFDVWSTSIEPLLKNGQSVNDIFEARKLLTGMANGMGPDAGAAGAIKRALDDELVKLGDDALLHGDPETIGKWLDAIGAFKEFKQKWETEGILKKLTSTSMRDGETVLTVAPSEAANAIFGAALNPNKTNLARDLLTLKKNLPTDVWDQVRQEFFMRLSDRMLNPKGEIQGAMFSKGWASVKKNKTLLNALFTKEEQATIDGLATTALTISSRSQNYSNSANSLMGALQRFVTALGSTAAMRGLSDLAPVMAAKSAIGMGALARPPMQVVPPYGVQAGAVGGTVGGDAATIGTYEWLFGDRKQ